MFKKWIFIISGFIVTFVALLTFFLIVLFKYCSLDITYTTAKFINIFGFESDFDSLILCLLFVSAICSYVIIFLFLAVIRRSRE